MTMTPDQAADLIRDTLMITLLISAPLLMVALIVGLVISLIQAITQIQEQTLSFIPKVAAMILAAIFLLPWITTQMLDYAYPIFSGQGP